MISSAVLQAYTGSTDTATLAFFEKSSVAWLQTWIPRYLGVSATLTEILDGPRRQHDRISGRGEGERLRTQWLFEEIAEGSLISVEERTSTTSSWVDYPNPADLTDYEIRTAAPYLTTGRQIVKLSSSWPAGTANIRIKYTHGYAEDAGPDDVTTAILQMVDANILVQGTSGGAKRMEEEGSEVEFFDPSTMPGYDMRLIASLRRPSY